MLSAYGFKKSAREDLQIVNRCVYRHVLAAGDGADDVGAADDADDLAVAHDRHALDIVRCHELRDLLHGP